MNYFATDPLLTTLGAMGAVVFLAWAWGQYVDHLEFMVRERVLDDVVEAVMDELARVPGSTVMVQYDKVSAAVDRLRSR